MHKKGFTLVEILFVVVIIGILVAILVPNALKAVTAANTKACAGNIRALDAAFMACYADLRTWAVNSTGTGDCSNIAGLVAGGYIEAAPVCPFGVPYATTTASGGVQCNKANHFSAVGTGQTTPGTWPHVHNQ